MRRFLARFGLGLGIMCLFVIVVILVPIEVFGPDGLPRMQSLQSELDTIEQESDVLREENSRLRKQIKDLREDPAAIERIARDELGMAGPDEIIFQFEPETAAQKK